jgi:hypothetical protein
MDKTRMATRPVDDAIALDRPLPGDVLRRVRTGLSAYQNYPVFSGLWLRGRTVRFVLITSVIGVLIWIGARVSRHPLSLAAPGYFIAGFTAMASTGPALATWVRHRRWPLRKEQLLVIVALLVGVLASSVIDGWASHGLDVAFGTARTKTPAEGVFNALLQFGIGFVIYALLGGALAVPRYFTELRRLGELRHEQALAALEARHRELDVKLGLLQAQVEPHFLFNTLASVHALIASDPPAAQRLVDSLVGYLRATIPRLRGDAARLDATLGQQLEICASYLAVMQTRMGGRLAVHVDVPEALHAAVFPPLLLMTLVENSVKHGIEPKPGPGAITVRARATADALELEVKDDGAGLRAVSGGGLGLANLRAQLLARYGERAAFALTGGVDGGAAATVRIPLEVPRPS